MSGKRTGPAHRLGAHSILPARREPVAFRTEDGVDLVGELDWPVQHQPRATLIMLHPLPTEGGSSDSHLYRKAAWRLPAMADLAVLRFNSRGTTSSLGRSAGQFDQGRSERFDLAAAVGYARDLHLPHLWLVGWSFGSEVVLMHGAQMAVDGAVLLSPPLKRAGSADLVRWAASRLPLVALVPETDQFLAPKDARDRFGLVSHARVVAGPGFGHLWIGEKAVHWALSELTKAVGVRAEPLPKAWSGPVSQYHPQAGKVSS